MRSTTEQRKGDLHMATVAVAMVAFDLGEWDVQPGDLKFHAHQVQKQNEPVHVTESKFCQVKQNSELSASQILDFLKELSRSYLSVASTLH